MLALLGAIVVGLSLGLLGSGGAILAIPVLVSLLGHPEKQAVVESLAIVGAIALASAALAASRRRVDWASVALLALPGMAGSYAGAWISTFVPGGVQLGLLAGLMLAAAALLLRRGPGPAAPDATTADAPAPREAEVQGKVAPRRTMTPAAVAIGALQGVLLGLVTGFVGIGGGFLIVPTLVLLRRLPMGLAVGTSLAIIAFNCAAGLGRHLASAEHGDPPADWHVVATFILLGLAGSAAGAALRSLLPQRAVRLVFAVVLVALAAVLLLRAT